MRIRPATSSSSLSGYDGTRQRSRSSGSALRQRTEIWSVFVLGTGIGPGDWWWDRLNATLAVPHRARWLEQQQFGVAELVVKPSHRRSGLGRALMNDVLDGLPYNSALLACYPDAVAPQGLYTSLGWTVIDPCLRVSASHPTQIMGIRLRPRTSRRITLPARSSVEG